MGGVIERFDATRPGGNLAYRCFAREHVQRYEIAAACLAARTTVGGPIVDAACGLGYGCPILTGAPGGPYIGIDGDPATVEGCCRRYPGHRFLCRDLDRPGCFDLPARPSAIVSLETAEHLADPAVFLTAARRALAPGGVLVFSAPTSLTMDFDPYHRRDWSADEWAAAIESAGFAVQARVAMPFETSFWSFATMVPTTWRQKWRVARFALADRRYRGDRIRNWVLQNRFYWCSTLFVAQ